MFRGILNFVRQMLSASIAMPGTEAAANAVTDGQRSVFNSG